MAPRFLAVCLALSVQASPASAQWIERVTIDSMGMQSDDMGVTMDVSFDGRVISYYSLATNLVPNDMNGKCDVFVRDRFTGTTERVSVDSSGVEGDGDSYSGYVSSNGRFVSFASEATNLATSDGNGSPDAFVRDRVTGTTVRVSVDSAGNEADFGGEGGPISADGNIVAFGSYATNLVPSDTNGAWDVFVRDLSTGITEMVSVDPSGACGDLESNVFSMTPDGRYVLFWSRATNLVSGDTNSCGDLFVRDRILGTTTRVSVDSTGTEADGESRAGDITPDGRFVAFLSIATNLVANDTNGWPDVFVRDLSNGTTERVSVRSNGAQANGASNYNASISADGMSVAFTSWATNLVGGDRNGADDVFVHDRTTGRTRRASVDALGGELNGPSYFGVLSDDSRFVAFASDATNAVTGDTNGVGDIFIAGPYLTLEADPPSAPAGAILSLSNWTGLANAPALIVVTDVNGAPTFVPAVLGAFDAAGAWGYSATVPGGLSGNLLTLTTFGYAPDGRVHASNAVAVAFQ
jgi:Tol biopolymer transport system component